MATQHNAAREKKRARANTTLELVLGNTYARIPESSAALSHDGKRKVLDWSIYVRVADGDGEDILSVTFHLHPSFKPDNFTKTLPPFESRQQSYGAFTTEICIRLVDGSSHTIRHLLVLRNGGSSKQISLQVGTQRSARPCPDRCPFPQIAPSVLSLNSLSLKTSQAVFRN